MANQSGRQDLSRIYDDIVTLKEKYDEQQQHIQQLLSLNQKVDFLIEEMKRMSQELTKVSDILVQQATIKKEIEMLDYRTKNEITKDLQILNERIKYLELQTEEIKHELAQGENKISDIIKTLLFMLLGFMVGLLSKIVEKFIS
jgi:lipopolysaccharide export LptBFGC system permease protein LptF